MKKLLLLLALATMATSCTVEVLNECYTTYRTYDAVIEGEVVTLVEPQTYCDGILVK